jgi:type II secretory pathway component GspD/PulD (secretin)
MPQLVAPQLLVALLLFCTTLPAVAQSLEPSSCSTEGRRRDPDPAASPRTRRVITGTGAVLLVRASPGNVQQIRDALAALDQAPRQLLITVGQATGVAASRSNVQGQVTIRTGESPDGTDRTAVSGAVTASGIATRAEIRNVSSVRALEGMESYVMVGESRPFSSSAVTPGWHGMTETHVTEYHDVATGFYVTPRIAGDVTLEISRAAAPLIRPVPRHAVVASQRATHREWTTRRLIGLGARSSQDAAQRGILTGALSRV